ncbi:ABC transporter substrate-binding protein [Aurantimicrobium minutum]|uniref:ABC transporter substrate-binding protein n=1 Tax=Aurantimicrobium minutum TaxID=708131 RepID=UPI0024732A0D|nr:ABC transporter substrate-binding protein [Aurantimicrobium minutum]MDH6208413.1 branched-chain amino acid transport system substrate-binding protein [Aurantimicrobium minutum]
MNFRKRALTMLGIAAAASLALSGCAGGDSSDQAATGDPILVAAVFDSNFFPEAPPAAKAVFDEYNAKGGFNGRPIQLDTYDEKTDPATSATATKDALDSGIIAFVGSSSVMNCAVNNTTWTENNIVSIQGTAVDPFCFATPNVAAANTGPFFATASSLYSASELMGYDNICSLILPDDGVAKAAYEQAIGTWEKATGKKLAYNDMSLTRGQTSFAANVAKMKSENCGAFFTNSLGADAAAILAEMTNQGLVIPAVLESPAYSEEFAASVNYGAEITLQAEFAPFTDPEDPVSKEWRELMEKNGISPTSFAQGGFLAAQYFIAILETIDGEVTRDSFTEAAKNMSQPYEGVGASMIGTGWIFGPGDSHQPNAATWMMSLEPNSQEWVSKGPWLTGEDIGWTNTKIVG